MHTSTIYVHHNIPNRLYDMSMYDMLGNVLNYWEADNHAKMIKYSQHKCSLYIKYTNSNVTHGLDSTNVSYKFVYE